MEVIYIYGSGGTGKSSFAEAVARKRGYSFKRSASARDPLGSYKGQDSFCLDDMRGDSFGFSDWLNILDNYQDHDGSSRFHDKLFIECKVLFITSTQSPEQFWEEMSYNRKTEDRHQFYRRIKTVIHMTTEKIYCKRYDEATKSYGKEFVLENDIKHHYSIAAEDEAEQKEKVARSLGVDQTEFKAHIEVEEPQKSCRQK